MADVVPAERAAADGNSWIATAAWELLRKQAAIGVIRNVGGTGNDEPRVGRRVAIDVDAVSAVASVDAAVDGRQPHQIDSAEPHGGVAVGLEVRKRQAGYRVGADAVGRPGNS